jgi:hypothetical protein
MAILIEYAIAPAAISVFIGGYIEALGLFGLTSGWPIYLACYAVFVGIHLYGVGEAMRLMFAITVATLGVVGPYGGRAAGPESRSRRGRGPRCAGGLCDRNGSEV